MAQESEQRAQAGDTVTLFEENGTVYKTGTLDRLDHDTAYVQVDADADGDTEKEVLGWICSRVAAVEQRERREMPARSGRCASGTASLANMLGGTVRACAF